MNSTERLGQIIGAVTDRMHHVELRELTPKGAVFLEVSGSLLRGCLECSRGVYTLAVSREFGGIISAMRTGFEMWRELDFLVRSSDGGTAAVKAKARAYMEVIDSMEGEPESDFRELNERGLEELRELFPLEVKQASDERIGTPRKRKDGTQKAKGRPLHWTGKSTRTDVLAGDDQNLKRIYRLLSWEAHPQMCFIRDISTEVVDRRHHLRFHSGGSRFEIIEQTALAAGEYLRRAWNDFADAWGQHRIDPPLPEAP